MQSKEIEAGFERFYEHIFNFSYKYWINEIN